MRIEIKDKKHFVSMFNDLFTDNKINDINAISIDSRKIQKGDIFVPIKGENFNGNRFISRAFKNGAIKCFSEDENNHKNIIKINSSNETINILANYWQNKSKHKVIGITGSNGKTTAKDLLYFILSEKYKCSKTPGNFNSTIGLPIAYLGTKINDDYCIIEYGASKPGEIKNLCRIVKPDISLITNISNAHIENYTSIEEILSTKKAIFECLYKDDTAFINNDDKYIKGIHLDCNKITFSIFDNANYSFKNQKQNKNMFKIPQSLTHLKSLVLSIYAISLELGISHDQFINALEKFKLPSGRGLSLNINGIKIIDDSYNANPSSVILAINRIDSLINDGNKIFIFGDMHELGDKSISEHEKIAKHVNNSDINIIITYGKFSYNTFSNLKNSITKKHFSSISEIKKYLKTIINKGDLIYLKGSRTMKLEEVYKGGLA